MSDTQLAVDTCKSAKSMFTMMNDFLANIHDMAGKTLVLNSKCPDFNIILSSSQSMGYKTSSQVVKII
jgi:hypothetical protein